MSANTGPDSAKAALIRQDVSRFTRSDPRDRSPIIMAQLAPATVTVSVDQLRSLQEQASDLAIKASFLLEACGVDYTRPAPTVIPDNRGSVVVDLAAARAARTARQAVTR